MTRRRLRNPDPDGHLSPLQVATHWNVSEALVRKLCRCGSLVAHRVGPKWRIPPEAMAEYEREQRVGE
jgi:excisionase family DNA binding protein